MIKTEKKSMNGDVVYVFPEDEYAIIKWDDDDGTARFDICFNEYIANFDNYFANELEVIGNIYENKEFLNETD